MKEEKLVKKAKIPIREGLFHIPNSPEDEAYLIGSKCANCGYVAFPKTEVCPSCMKENNMKEIPLSPRGKLDTFAVVRQAPIGFTAPYIMAYIKLPEGPKIFTTVIGCETKDNALRIGQEMKLIIDKIREDDQGNEVIAWKFKPVSSP